MVLVPHLMTNTKNRIWRPEAQARDQCRSREGHKAAITGYNKRTHMVCTRRDVLLVTGPIVSEDQIGHRVFRL